MSETVVFHSRYPNLLYLMRTGKGIQFLAGEYVTEDAAEIAMLREIAHSEARCNRAMWEAGIPASHNMLGCYTAPPVGVPVTGQIDVPLKKSRTKRAVPVSA